MALPKRKLKEFEKRQRVIVSVANFTAFDEMRPNGYFKLPGRKAGERYATLTVYDSITKAPLGDDKFQEVTIDVDDLAESLVNDHHADKFGCFVAAGMVPTEEELVAAEKTYYDWGSAQLIEADGVWESFHKYIFIGKHAKAIAKERNEKRAWVDPVRKTKPCPNCGVPNMMEQARCGCGAIINYNLALEYGLLTDREEERARAAGKFVETATLAEVADINEMPAALRKELIEEDEDAIPAEARTTSMVEAE